MTKLMLALFVLSSISSFASEAKVELPKQTLDKNIVLTIELNDSIVSLNKTLNVVELKNTDWEYTASNIVNSTRTLTK